MFRSTRAAPTAGVLGIAALGLAAALGACDRTDGPAAVEMDHAGHAMYSQHAVTTPEVQQWLSRLRAATAPFHDIDAAASAGYVTPITTCMEEPGSGGMGYHYAHLDLLDDVVEETRPEALLYEPQKNGRYRLVAVEYIVPWAAWNQPDPPVLHGLTFLSVPAFEVWALHVWVWRHNPSGMFASWNPTVSCAHDF